MAAAAWVTLDGLLRGDNLPVDVYFFAANSLRAKIRRFDSPSFADKLAQVFSSGQQRITEITV